jgi:plasmid stabilization system protein ParE
MSCAPGCARSNSTRHRCGRCRSVEGRRRRRSGAVSWRGVPCAHACPRTAAPMAIRVRQLAESDLEDFWRYTATHWSPGQTDRYHSDLIATRTRGAAYREGRPYLTSARQDFPCFSVRRGTPCWAVAHQRMDVRHHLLSESRRAQGRIVLVNAEISTEKPEENHSYLRVDRRARHTRPR